MLSAKQILEMKVRGEHVSMTTAYDFAFARMAEAAGVDQILVGDSLANVMLGYKSTREIGMTEMEIFTAAVCRGAPNTHVVADMPYASDETPSEAVRNAKRLIACGASSVKLEGAKLDVLKAIRDAGIDVVGHLGLLPQTATSFKQCGKTEEDAERIFNEAMQLDELGIFSFVLEHIPSELGTKISKAVKAVTIGIGAGGGTDGQVLVMHDFMRMHPNKVPPFVTQFANMYDAGVEGFKKYVESVKGN